MTKFCYKIGLQFLGFRYHGWAKQSGMKTVHEMVDKTIRFILPSTDFKTLGSGRTDAMVSANDYALELFSDAEIDTCTFLEELNINLPPDIRAMYIEPIAEDFNIITTAKVKEYFYLFAFGAKNHPFSAPLLTSFHADLDIEAMKRGARLFEGTHNFKQYCTKPSESGTFVRTIISSKIIPNTVYTASFFPKESYIFKVKSAGFMRNQIRLMMGQLILLGEGSLSLDELEASLSAETYSPLRTIAPASGLLLHSIEYRNTGS